MRFTFLSSTFVASVAMLGVASSAQAGTIYDNLGPGDSFKDGGYILQGPLVNNIGDVDQAARFSTGGHKHSGIMVSAGVSTTGPLPFDGKGPISIQLWSDGGATGPGSVLASETVNLNTFGQKLISATFGSLDLDANTNYWVVLDGLTTYDGAWDQNDQGIAGVSAGRSNGGAWNMHTPGDQFSLRVVSRVETVPEPASVAALAVGAVAMLRRRKRA